MGFATSAVSCGDHQHHTSAREVGATERGSSSSPDNRRSFTITAKTAGTSRSALLTTTDSGRPRQDGRHREATAVSVVQQVACPRDEGFRPQQRHSVVHVPVLLSGVLHPFCATDVSEVREFSHAHRRSVRATGARSLPLRRLWTRLVTRFR